MKVHVKFLATIREITGEHEIELELCSGDTVEAVMRALDRRYGMELKEATTGTTAGGISKISILVNGRDMDFLSGLETELKAGDVIVLIPPVAGG